MATALPPFPAHPAFAGLGAHFAKMAVAGDTGALREQARRQASELNKQLRVAGGRRPDPGQGRRDYDIIIARMTRDKVDATDLITLISWLETVAESRADANRFLEAAE